MGHVIDMAELRLRRAARERTRASGRDVARSELYFDLASPFTYLVAERAERLLPGAEWIPAAGPGMGPEDRRRAEARASALRLPLVWPDEDPGFAPRAMRVAAFAAGAGRTPRFVLAACRLAWAGGFDLEGPELIAEAASAAGLDPDRCIEAAGDAGADAGIAAAGRHVRALGARRLPAIVVGGAVFAGEDQIVAAAAYARAGATG